MPTLFVMLSETLSEHLKNFLDDRLYFSIGYDLFDHIKQWGSELEYGMTHNIYNISGLYDSTGNNSLNEFINDYWHSFVNWNSIFFRLFFKRVNY